MSFQIRRVGVTAGLAVVAVAMLGACSSSGGGSSKPPTTAELRSTLLKAGDLPSSWKQGAADNSSNSDSTGVDAQLAACIGVPAKDLNDSKDKTTVNSPQFTQGQSSVSSDAEASKSSGLSDKLAQDILTSSKTNSCFSKILRQTLAKQLPSGATIDQADAKVTKPDSSYPSNAKLVFDATIGVSAAGQSIKLYITTVEIASKRVSASVDFEGFGQPIPSSVRSAALKAVSERVSKV